jgi:hypothetical protein
MRWIFFFNLPNSSSRNMALGSTQTPTEMSTRNLPGGRRVRLTTLPSSMIRLSREMWEPRRLTALWAFTVCYRDNFTLPQRPDRPRGPTQSPIQRVPGFFLELKQPGREADHSPPSNAEIKNYGAIRLHGVVLTCLINQAQG